MSSSSAAGASDGDAALDGLSGPELVARLRVTSRRADWDAAARVLDARDRRLAEAEAKLAESQAALVEVIPGLASANADIQSLREKYHALKAAQSGPIRGPSRGAIADPRPRGDGRAEVGEIIDLSDDSSDDEDWEEGEFRPDAARVSCKRNAPACEGSSSSDDEDDRMTLSHFVKKRRGAMPVPNGEPKEGNGDLQANSDGSSGDHPPERTLVNRGDPKASAGKGVDASQKEVSFVQGRGRICQSGERGGLSGAMPSPPPIDSAVGSSLRKNSPNADGSEDSARIGGKQGSAAGPPFQVRTPNNTDMARRIVESARAGAETPKEHNGSALDASISLVLKTIGGVQKMKGPLQAVGIVEKAFVVSRAIGEQQKTQGQVLKVDVLPGTNGIGQQSGKLSMCHNKEVTDGGRLRSSDKPGSASLQPNNQLTLHSEQVPADSSLHTSLQPKNQLTLHSEQVPADSSLSTSLQPSLQPNNHLTLHSEQVPEDSSLPVESSLPSAVTKHWNFASDVYLSCLENNEIGIQAACALARQRKLTVKGYSKLSKFDVQRATALVEFLLDGNLQGPRKRTSEELMKHDSGGIDLLVRVALEFSEQLFSIYMNKEDPYFR